MYDTKIVISAYFSELMRIIIQVLCKLKSLFITNAAQPKRQIKTNWNAKNFQKRILTKINERLTAIMINLM